MSFGIRGSLHKVGKGFSRMKPDFQGALRRLPEAQKFPGGNDRLAGAIFHGQGESIAGDQILSRNRQTRSPGPGNQGGGTLLKLFPLSHPELRVTPRGGEPGRKDRDLTAFPWPPKPSRRGGRERSAVRAFGQKPLDLTLATIHAVPDRFGPERVGKREGEARAGKKGLFAKFPQRLQTSPAILAGPGRVHPLAARGGSVEEVAGDIDRLLLEGGGRKGQGKGGSCGLNGDLPLHAPLEGVKD